MTSQSVTSTSTNTPVVATVFDDNTAWPWISDNDGYRHVANRSHEGCAIRATVRPDPLGWMRHARDDLGYFSHDYVDGAIRHFPHPCDLLDDHSYFVPAVSGSDRYAVHRSSGLSDTDAQRAADADIAAAYARAVDFDRTWTYVSLTVSAYRGELCLATRQLTGLHSDSDYARFNVIANELFDCVMTEVREESDYINKVISDAGA